MKGFVDAIWGVFDAIVASLARIERDLCTAALGMDGVESESKDAEP